MDTGLFGPQTVKPKGKKLTRKEQEELARRERLSKRKERERHEPPYTEPYLTGAVPYSATAEQIKRASAIPLVAMALTAFRGTIRYVKEEDQQPAEG